MKNFKQIMISTLFCFILLCCISNTAFASVKNPSKPKNVKVSVGNKSITLTWSPSKEATGYRIYQYDASQNTYQKIGSVKSTNFTVSGLKNNVSHQYKIRAFKRINGKNYYSNTSSVISAIPTITIKKPTSLLATGVKRKVSLTWNKVRAAARYRIYQYDTSKRKYVSIGTSKKNTYVVTNLTGGNTYQFKVRGYKNADGKTYYSKYSSEVSATLPSTGVSTIKTFLKTALQPVGSTMYIWGGGWNKADTGAGEDATRIGVNPNWRKYFTKQTSSYNYRETKYQHGNGLDCSGYVGWTIYNVLNTTDGKKGYVMKAKKMASNFASRGWGTYVSRPNVTNYKAGDIMSSACSCCGHVWIVIGSCSDGSVVLVHSSPSGVQINGTVTPSGNYNSEAISLATKYMKKYYSKWYKKFPDCSRGTTYLSHYSQMRWDTTGNSIMTDPNGYTNMSASEILKDLFKN